MSILPLQDIFTVALYTFLMDKIESAILRWLAILLIPAVAGLSVYVSILLEEYENTRNIFNGYISPNDLYSVVTISNEATVSIACENKNASGFGFIFDEFDDAQFSFDYPVNE